MEFIQVYSHSHFLSIAHKIKQKPAAWQIVDVALTGKTVHNPSYIALKLKQHFADRDGIILLCSGRQVLVIVNLGETVSIPALSERINLALPLHSCKVEAASLSDAGIIKLQVRLQGLEQSRPENELFQARRARREDVVMVVDDDRFIRNIFRQHLGPGTTVIEAPDMQRALECYLETLPDAVFIDIHLPDGSGTDLIRDILQFDSSAFLVGMSIDSVKKNVLEAQKQGARSFLCKPFTPKTIRASLEKCETLARH